jgi:hypothetical protein
MKIKVVLANSNIGEHLIIRNIPAVTKVAAWINADTGVGPSIASGNHTCNPNCADLPTEPTKRKKQMTFKQLNFEPKIENEIFLKKDDKVKTIEKSTVRKK